VTRVLVIARSAVERAGLSSLAGAGGLEVAGAVPSLPPHPDADVLLVAGDADGVAQFPLPAVLLSDADAGNAIARGARAVLPADADEAEIVAAVAAAGAGLVALRPEDMAPLMRRTGEGTERLTGREQEVLALLAEGAGNKRIARDLGITEHTVKFHVGSIMGKLGASSRTEAVTIGIRQGLIMV